MGLINSRRSTSVEEADNPTNNLYRYPPKSGCYFGSYFIMGGERFDTNQQDTYLFGENEDLNFLGSKPVPFPYPAPQPHEPTKTLKSLVNIRRDSLKFVKETEDAGRVKPDGELAHSRYNVEFTFDSDVKCAITIYYFATEEITNKQAVYHPRDARMNSETFHYKRGANQVFSQSTHVIDPTQFAEDEWQYNIDKEVIPVVIQCVVEEEEFLGHSHATFAIFDKSCDGGFVLKCLKQKQMIDGVCYLLQEVYGIENKNVERAKEDDIEDNGSECVICMCETRDTLILPCRHLCLCNGCADNLRYQANNCPICRAKFSALLQIRAMRRKVLTVGIGGGSLLSNRPLDYADESAPCQEGVPPGYEAVSLIEALNGPPLPQCALSATVMTSDITIQSISSAESPRDGLAERLENTHVGNGNVRKHPSIAELSVLSETELAPVAAADDSTIVKICVQNDSTSCSGIELPNNKQSVEQDVVLTVEDPYEEKDVACAQSGKSKEVVYRCIPGLTLETVVPHGYSAVLGDSEPDDATLRRARRARDDDVKENGTSSELRSVLSLSTNSHSSPESSCTSSSYCSSKELLNGSVETTDSEFL